MVWLVFDHAVFSCVNRAVFLLMAPQIVREVFWGY